MSLPTNLNLADWPLLPEPRPLHPLLTKPSRPHCKEKQAALCQVDGMNDQEESEEEGFGYDDEEEEEGGGGRDLHRGRGGRDWCMVHGAGQREVRVRGRDLAWIKIHEYETTLEYLSSDIFKELANGNYSLRKLGRPIMVTLLSWQK